METRVFEKLLSQIENLTSNQVKQLQNELNQQDNRNFSLFTKNLNFTII